MEITPLYAKDELISMEEGRSNTIVNVVGHEQRQTCEPDSSQPCSNSDFRCASLRNKFQSLDDAISEDGADEVGSPKIQKASDMLRHGENIKLLEPRMVSIGPLHHRVKFEWAEKLKLKLAALFIKKHRLAKVGLYNKINGQIQSLRKCYVEEDIKDINNDDLAWILLVDGCALIHYIDCASNNMLQDLKIKMDMEVFAPKELFLLENQLPYQVLHILIKSIDRAAAKDVENSINKFVDKTVRKIRGRHSSPSTSSATSLQPPLRNTTPAHLLELLWRHLVGDNTSSQDVKSKSSSCDRPPGGLVGANREPYRSVNELKGAWIRFKPDTKGSLRDASFSPHPYWFTGTLRLPSIVVDNSTESMFLNLIAFEMCPDFENDFPVSSYISFLESLIDEKDDVKDLRKAQILHNALGSDEKVSTVFNETYTDVVSNPRIYAKVKNGIQIHCRKEWNTWMAQAYHGHFRSPWTFLAFAAAIAALAMTFVQTWYTIYPSK